MRYSIPWLTICGIQVGRCCARMRQYRSYSPRMRGWSHLFVQPSPDPHTVFLAFAGMVRISSAMSVTSTVPSPRMRGWSGRPLSHEDLAEASSPRMREWSPVHDPAVAVRLLFLAYVGMVLWLRVPMPRSACSPRVGGDGPAFHIWRRTVETFSPRMRGWSLQVLAARA